MPKLPTGTRVYINGVEYREDVPEVLVNLLPKKLFAKTTTTKTPPVKSSEANK